MTTAQALENVLNAWVNGRKVRDGIPLTIRQQAEQALLTADAQATVEALRRERDELMENLSLCKGNELAAQVDELQATLDAEREKVKTLRDENVLLRSALRPFAEVGDALDTREFINLYERRGTSGKRHIISMQHLKQASAIYGGTK